MKRMCTLKSLAWVVCAALPAACGGGGGGGGGGSPDLQAALDVTAADFNHDGHIDVAQAIWRGAAKSGIVRVFQHVSMTGRGYQAPVDVLTDQSLDSIVSADLDGDGLPDIVAAGDPKNVFVLLNSPGSPGTFRPPQVVSADSVSGIAIGDMNADGRPDLLLAAHTVLLALQAVGAPGTFAPPTTLYASPSGKSAWKVAVGALNDDALPDIALAGNETDSAVVSALFHASAADPPAIDSALNVFTATLDRSSPPSSPDLALCIADLDGDGRNDVAVSDRFGGSVAVLLQSHATGGQFLPAMRFGPLSVGWAEALSVGDLNRDGHPDLVTGGSNGVRVFLQDPARPGSYFASNAYGWSEGAATGVAIADVDDDGFPDVITDSGNCTVVTQSLCARAPPGVLYQDSLNPGHFLPLRNLE